LALLALSHGLHTSSLALHRACGGSWLLAQSCFLLEYCTAFIFGLLEGGCMLNALTWVAVFLAGGIFAVVVGAVFIWAIFHIQNGGRDD
jgi:hypothetical protein